MTSRIETKLDDIIVDMVEEPVVFAIIASGIWFGLTILILPKMAETAISHSYAIILSLLVGWPRVCLMPANLIHLIVTY